MFTASIANIVHWGSYHAWRRRWTLEPLRAVISNHLGREVADDEQIPLSVWAEAPHEEGPHMEDYEIRWILARLPGGPQAIAAFAADCAEMVLPIWGAGPPLPAECIAATRAWAADPTPELLQAVGRLWVRAREITRRADPMIAYGPSTEPSVLAGQAAWQAAVDATDVVGVWYAGRCRAAENARDAFKNTYHGTQNLYLFASAGLEMRARQRARLLQYLQDEPLPPLPALPARDEVAACAAAWRAADEARAAAREARAMADGWGAQP